MKKAIKILISIIGVAYLSLSIFYCFVAGAPPDREGAIRYMIYAGIFSLLVSGSLCGGVHYIHYLHKKLEKQRN